MRVNQVLVSFKERRYVSVDHDYRITVHDSEAKAQQWRYSYKHAQDKLPGGFRGVVDVEDFSNLDFFRRFSHDSRLHTLSQIYSSACRARAC